MPIPRTPTRSNIAARVVTMLAVLTLLFGSAVAARAADIPRLTGPITDQTGVLAGHEAEITDALNTLQDDHNVQLWVLFVPTTGDQNVTTYADAVAQANSLGVNDALLVVAIEDRTDAIWVSDGLPQITNDEVDAIISRAVEPKLAAGDFAGAVVAGAEGLGASASGTVPPPTIPPATAGTGNPTSGQTVAPTNAGGGSTSGGDGVGGLVLPVVGALLILAGLYVVFAFVMRRRGAAQAARSRDQQTGDLARQMSHDLITADEAVRDAQQDLGFAEAQFDDADIAPYRDAVAKAAGEIRAAFGIRQQLDDAVPDDPFTRERLLAEMSRHLGTVKNLLTGANEQIAALREQQRRAPEVLDQLGAQISGLDERLVATGATLQRLTAYAASSWQSIGGNKAEAEKRIAFAKDALTRGRAALAAQDGRSVAVAVADAQGAIGEATDLVTAIERIAASLDEARDRLPAELDAAAKDVDAARQALGSTPTADQTAQLASAAQLLDRARTGAAESPPDVLAAFRDAGQANAAADAIVGAVREAEARRARQQAILDAALRSATMSVARADDYIQTRRGGIRAEARTRLVEAQRQLEQANSIVASDPDRAASSAGRARQLADDAYRLASGDFDDFDQHGPGDDTAAVSGAFLGALFGGILSGGRRGGSWNGGGWAGSPWGSSGNPGNGGGRSGGLGGFGGGRGGGGRTIGGSWGGLGGRSRGGHW